MKGNVRAAEIGQVTHSKSKSDEILPQVIPTANADARGPTTIERRDGNDISDERDHSLNESDAPSMNGEGVETEAVMSTWGQKFTRVILDNNANNISSNCNMSTIPKNTQATEKTPIISKIITKNNEPKIKTKGFWGRKKNKTNYTNTSSANSSTSVLSDTKNGEECVDMEDTELKRELEESFKQNPQGSIPLRKLLKISSKIIEKDEKLESFACESNTNDVVLGQNPMDSSEIDPIASNGSTKGSFWFPFSFASLTDQVSNASKTESSQQQTVKESGNAQMGKRDLSEDQVSPSEDKPHATTGAVSYTKKKVTMAQMRLQKTTSSNKQDMPVNGETNTLGQTGMDSTETSSGESRGSFMLPFTFASLIDQIFSRNKTEPSQQHTIKECDNVQTKSPEFTVEEALCSGDQFQATTGVACTGKDLFNIPEFPHTNCSDEMDWDLAENLAEFLEAAAVSVADVAVGSAEPSSSYSSKSPELIQKEMKHLNEVINSEFSSLEQKEKAKVRLTEISSKPHHSNSKEANKAKSVTRPSDLLSQLFDIDDIDSSMGSSYEDEDSTFETTFSGSTATQSRIYNRKLSSVTEGNGRQDWLMVGQGLAQTSRLGNQPNDNNIALEDNGVDVIQPRNRTYLLGDDVKIHSEKRGCVPRARSASLLPATRGAGSTTSERSSEAETHHSTQTSDSCSALQPFFSAAGISPAPKTGSAEPNISQAHHMASKQQQSEEKSSTVIRFLHNINNKLSSVGLGMSIDEDDGISFDSCDLLPLKGCEKEKDSVRSLEEGIKKKKAPFVISDAEMRILQKHAQILGIDVYVLIDAQINGTETLL